MSIDEMSKTVTEIQEQIMFQTKVSINDYASLLAAVEELRYFLKVDLQVPPVETVACFKTDASLYTF